MIMKIIGAVILSSALNVVSAFITTGNDAYVAIDILDVHYNTKLCLDILLVDCATHVTNGDEMVCGTDGVTYENHCKFAHAVCESLNSRTQVLLANHGSCTQTTAPVTSGPMTTTAYVTTKSMTPSLLCTYMNSVNCATFPLEIICGPDGRRYVNNCELAKETCNNPSLKAVGC